MLVCHGPCPSLRGQCTELPLFAGKWWLAKSKHPAMCQKKPNRMPSPVHAMSAQMGDIKNGLEYGASAPWRPPFLDLLIPSHCHTLVGPIENGTYFLPTQSLGFLGHGTFLFPHKYQVQILFSGVRRSTVSDDRGACPWWRCVGIGIAYFPVC